MPNCYISTISGCTTVSGVTSGTTCSARCTIATCTSGAADYWVSSVTANTARVTSCATIATAATITTNTSCSPATITTAATKSIYSSVINGNTYE